MLQWALEVYYNRDPGAQLYLASDKAIQERTRNKALLTIVVAVLAVPLWPLFLILLWSALKPRYTHGKHQKRATAGTASGEAGGQVLTALPVPEAVVLDVDEAGATLRCGAFIALPHSSCSRGVVLKCITCQQA